MRNFPPERIICLTEETVETLYLLGEQDRIVGVTGYAVRPPAVRKEKERVAAFTSAKIDKILSLKPDLVLAFSDLQAEIVADLIKNGVAVMAYNQRDIAGILSMIRHLGATVGVGEKAESLASSYEKRLADLRNLERHDVRPRVYFEEWDSPMITGIKWVSELVEIAGGTGYRLLKSTHKGLTIKLIKTCRILLYDQIGSGTLEAFTSEVPTIVYWKRIYSREAPWAKELVADLEQYGVVHSEPDTLAKEIKTYLADPEDWMNNYGRKQAIKAFCEKFALTDSRWYDKWKEFLSKSNIQ